MDAPLRGPVRQAFGFRSWLIGSLLGLAASLALTGSAGAATIAVTTLNDEIGGDPGETGCSLREAVATANTDTPGDGCVLTAAAGTDTITVPNGTIDLATVGQALGITDDVNVDGPGMGLSLVTNTNTTDRIVAIGAGAEVTISDLSLTDGNLAGVSVSREGAGIVNSGELLLEGVRMANHQIDIVGNGNATGLGGAIFSAGGSTLTLDHSVIEDSGVDVSANTGVPGNTFVNAGGGAIYAVDSLDVAHSTIDGNDVTAVSSGGTGQANAEGGGIFAQSGLTLTHSTISDNAVDATAVGPGKFALAVGGGIQTTVGTDAIELSTIVDNTYSATSEDPGNIFAGGGGIYAQSSTVALRSSTVVANGPLAGPVNLSGNLRAELGFASFRNTIIALPRAPADNCNGPQTSLGFNLDFTFSGQDCGLNESTDLQTAPGLGALSSGGVNGGPTATMIPVAGSAVIDQGSSAGDSDPTHDQRDLSRPNEFANLVDAAGGDGSEIGAVEVQIAPPTFTSTTPASSPGSPGATATPIVTGTAQSPSTVRLFTDPVCSIQTGPAGTADGPFASPGITVDAVAPSTTTTFYGDVTTAHGTSSCSSGAFPNSIAYTRGAAPLTTPPATDPGPTGQRAAALKKCKKKKSKKARTKCKKRANRLPL
jgi:CSLREA domain-containing protein